jgi:signal transduction histidine kinase
MSNPQINLLYIDDEEANLSGFKAEYRKQYNIFTTTSVAEAEEILKNNEIHIVLADQRMPVMTGVQFFEKIRHEYSEPVRILISGYSDINAAIDSINKGEVFRFIDKPWDNKYVKTAIENAYDIYKTRKELRERNTELQKAYDELDKFVYSASHDLRAPLMSILGIVQLAELETGTTNQYLKLIEQSVHKLDKFILSIIDYYKNSRSDFHVGIIDFTKLLNDITESLNFMPGFSSIEFKITVNQIEPFRSDPIKLRIILNNIISNAVKYHDVNKTKRTIDVNISCDAQMCNIVVADNGIGLKDDERDNIFKMFFRGNNPNSGSGIGLYIVKEAVSKLNGHISVESNRNIGTRFIIDIPATD